MFPSDRTVTAALVTLITLQLIMLTALYAGIAPHPPAATPAFGMAPFLSVAISSALIAFIYGTDTRPGRAFAGLAAALALVSFGPQKYLDSQLPLIWPAVLTAQLAILVIIAGFVNAIRAGSAN